MSEDLQSRIIHVRGKMSQLEFARRMEINPNTLRNYENGRALPNQLFLSKICIEFGVNPRWILLGEGLPYNSDYEPGHEFETEDDLRESLAQLRKELDECYASIDEMTGTIDGLKKEKSQLHKAIAGAYVIETRQMQTYFSIQKAIIRATRSPNPDIDNLKEILENLESYINQLMESTTNSIETLTEWQKINDEE